jgi:hypothetical protein
VINRLSYIAVATLKSTENIQWGHL